MPIHVQDNYYERDEGQYRKKNPAPSAIPDPADSTPLLIGRINMGGGVVEIKREVHVATHIYFFKFKVQLIKVKFKILL